MVSKEIIIGLYQKLERFLESDDYEGVLKEELEESNPDCLEMLRKRRKDMEKTDHGVVFAGETSSGKTTLINKVLGMKIFVPRIHESTSTICKIRNSKQIRIIMELTSRETIVKDLTDACNLKTKAGEEKLRNALKRSTDLTVSEDGKNYRSVDIGLPIPILKGNTILVDTPGIGGSTDASRRLMEYLSNAVSFVFVINVASAGGMLSDRLPEILRSVRALSKENEMPCFQPEDAIFITNKWDTLSTDDDDDDEEVTRTWETIKTELKKEWPSVKEENIFNLNLKDVSPELSNPSTRIFALFKEKLDMNIEKAQNIRVVQHFRYLQTILAKVSKGLNNELSSNRKSEKREMTLATHHQEKMQNLDMKCKQIQSTLLSRTKQLIDDTIEEIYQCLESPEEKDKILNPTGLTPMLNISWTPYGFQDEVNSRISRYIEQKFQTKFTMFKAIENETKVFYKSVCKELSEMEKEWKNEMKDYSQRSYEGDTEDTSISAMYYPLIAVAGTAGFIVLTVLSPVLFPLFVYKDQKSIKQVLIDEAYNHIKSIVHTKVKDKLDSDCGTPLSKTICAVTDHLQTILKNAQELSMKTSQKLQIKLLIRRVMLSKLKNEVDKIEDDARKLQV